MKIPWVKNAFKLGVVMPACNQSYSRGRDRRILAGSQPGKIQKTLSKKRTKKQKGCRCGSC
jgi:hypothetical protein